MLGNFTNSKVFRALYLNI